METLDKNVLYELWQHCLQQQGRTHRLWINLPNKTPDRQYEEARLLVASWAHAAKELYRLYEQAQ